MEECTDSTTVFVWIVYSLFVVFLIGGFVVLLIRKNLLQETKRIEELSNLEEKHLRDLLQRHLESQEHERERIGSDLHDAISNRLNMILLRLRANSDTAIVEADVNETINAVRRISHDLNPPMIERFAADVLITSQFDRLIPEYKVDKWQKSALKLSWTTEQKMQIIRIVQELVNNIVKHAKANEVSIMLAERNKYLYLIVDDNGVGFIDNSKGMGMKNIENRLFILNGSFKVKSKLNKGTRIILAFHHGVQDSNSRR